ncbi:MAG: SMP-30/gluconolactonase/LRE family protein [Ruminococcaceae bacterium]|nr:SMP-30/gluconolactonase/LRE family protein [Oscillospiraceae bacterium]
MTYKPELLTDARCIVGEGPIWDNANGRLIMTDIQGKRMRTIRWSDGSIEDRILKEQTGFFLLTASGEVLGGAESGIYRISDGAFERVNKPFVLEGTRFNDGKVGPDGRAYVGTFSRDSSAAFYRMDADGMMEKLFGGVGNSNGLDWSPDGRTLYYNDTPTKRTDAFDFCDGRLSHRREVFRYEGGNPDGMTIDTDGNLWTAVWGSGEVLHIDPRRGKVIDKITLPVSQVACCAFAGKDMKTLVITTAAHGVHLRDEPLAGAVFAVRTEAEGMLPNRMDLDGGSK